MPKRGSPRSPGAYAREAAPRGWAAGLTVAAVALGSAASAQDDNDPRRFSVTPTLGLQAFVTDNADLTQDHRRTDVVSRAVLGLDAIVNDARAVGQLSTEVSYDRYARDADLSGVSLTADGSGAFFLVPSFLTIEAAGTVVSTRDTTFGAAAVDRSGVNGRAELATYRIGARLKTTAADLFDIQAAARFAQVSYFKADASEVDTALPSSDRIGQIVASADTAERLAGRQLVTTVELQTDSRDFRSATAIQSLYVRLSPRVRLLARGGFESIDQRRVVNLQAPVLSAGAEVTLNGASKITIEGGERYDHEAWAATAEINVSDRLIIGGAFTETVQPDQLLVANSFSDYVDRVATLAPAVAPRRFTLAGGIYQETSFNKVADLHAYYGGDRQSVRLVASFVDRKFLVTDGRDRTVTGQVSYQRTLRPDLSITVQGDYAQTFESPLYVPGRTYALQCGFRYRLNSTTEINPRYVFAYSEQSTPGGAAVRDNTVLFAIQKRF